VAGRAHLAADRAKVPAVAAVVGADAGVEAEVEIKGQGSRVKPGNQGKATKSRAKGFRAKAKAKVSARADNAKVASQIKVVNSAGKIAVLKGRARASTKGKVHDRDKAAARKTAISICVSSRGALQLHRLHIISVRCSWFWIPSRRGRLTRCARSLTR
jgi:hypothetical protein